MKCATCEFDYPDSFAACPSCGERNRSRRGPIPTPEMEQEVSSRLPLPQTPQVRKSVRGYTYATAILSFVLGILSLFLPAVPALILGALALVLGILGRKDNEKGTPQFGLATAGWILGMIGVVCAVIGLIIAAL